MKTKMTKKAVREYASRWGKPIIKISYCGLQFLLKFVPPFAYSARAEGWACDYYELPRCIISTGYAPIGRSVGYDVYDRYERRAEKVFREVPYEGWKEALEELIAEFEEEVLRRKVK